MNKVTIYPGKELKEWLDQEAEQQRRSLNQQILFILHNQKEVSDKNGTRN